MAKKLKKKFATDERRMVRSSKLGEDTKKRSFKVRGLKTENRIHKKMNRHHKAKRKTAYIKAI